jgi:hypothetical protein
MNTCPAKLLEAMKVLPFLPNTYVPHRGLPIYCLSMPRCG